MIVSWQVSGFARSGLSLFADQSEAAKQLLVECFVETAADLTILAPDRGRRDRAAAFEAQPDTAALGNHAVAGNPATIDRDIDQLAFLGIFAMLPDSGALNLDRMAKRLALFDQRRFHSCEIANSYIPWITPCRGGLPNSAQQIVKQQNARPASHREAPYHSAASSPCSLGPDP